MHSSLSSLGQVEGGAETVINTLLSAGCTVLVPAFIDANELPPPGHTPVHRNAWDERDYPPSQPASGFTTNPPYAAPIAPDIGVIPRTLVHMPGTVRGNHPINSFAAVGPLAQALIDGQTPWNVYAPFEALIAHDGFVVMMGVGLDRMTLLHDAERHAGRELLLRWGGGADGAALAARIGGCSEGFVQLDGLLSPLARETRVGASRWRAYPAGATRATAADAIRGDPTITHCDNPTCERCRDAAAGGPFLVV
jgi:aminoglycoside 3-N-acetyltransferase